jgi:tRNA-dihydrouridine synthase B
MAPSKKTPGEEALVRPVGLGPIHLPANLVLAPMHRHTHRIFRLLCRRSGAALAHTEMLTPEEVLDATGRKTVNVLASSPEDRPLGVQLLPREPDLLAEAIARLAAIGTVDLVDLNFACPSRRVVATDRGGAMLRRPDPAVRLVETAVQASPLPVTAKFRLGWSDCDEDRDLALDIACRAAEAGAVAVTLHARSVMQGYRGRADWRAIGRWAARLAVPVLGSGDLRSPDAVLAMLRESGCAGASLARGALGAPWIFRQTMDLAAGGAYDPVTTDERRETLLAHFAGLAEQYGEAAALSLMRQEGQYYARGMKGARALRVAIQAGRDAADFYDAVARHLADEPPPIDAPTREPLD